MTKFFFNFSVSTHKTSEKKTKLKKINARNLSIFSQSDKEKVPNVGATNSLGNCGVEEEEAEGMLEELEELREEGGRGQEVLIEALPLGLPSVKDVVLEDHNSQKTVEPKKRRLFWFIIFFLFILVFGYFPYFWGDIYLIVSMVATSKSWSPLKITNSYIGWLTISKWYLK